MDITILRAALRSHRLAVMLMILQVALACAVLCNALDLALHRYQSVSIDSGVDESALAQISLSGFEPAQADELNARVLDALRGIPGVRAAAAMNSFPYGNRAGTVGISLNQDFNPQAGVIDFYVGGPGTPEVLGLKISTGRLPNAAEYAPIDNAFPASPVTVVDRRLADMLWPGENSVGKSFYALGLTPVIGVMEDIVVPQPGGESGTHLSAFIPAQPGTQLAGNYGLRADPAALPEIMRRMPALMAKVAPEAVYDTEASRPLGELRERYYRNDRAMISLLLLVIGVMLAITAVGIVGLASFWVQQRTRQIGVRRALGATRGNILRHFLSENFMIVTLGILLGMLLAFGINQLLMEKYEMTRLPWPYLPLGALALWLLGQAAVLWPALRAARIPPATATRSV